MIDALRRAAEVGGFGSIRGFKTKVEHKLLDALAKPRSVGFITREWRDAAATRRACFLGESFAHVLVPKIISGVKGDSVASAHRSIFPNTMSSGVKHDHAVR